ncbi:HlyD family efflux transporter periplasmic adaptor subunit [Hyphobacterium sp. HN65]|uniref:HlyD family efflux transporter periplasmic adaptor subunit n=1 Tax=Hyphobacterium lacteum TaxID=3116575 RepID=A0ABU7LP87_9PROT|nr:HlyD family efflux transporter periplasmic adaptor subunit [Hyphobacterium sp. HN65]MEE2525436.1 HlyD family efflux transporter periplasmic adaptor subunit [Hyphobacterium sp. HN65]
MMRRAVLLLPLLIAACGETPDPHYLGYAEGDYRLIAPQVAGQIETIAVTEGQYIDAGDILFELDSSVDAEQLAAARARLEAATARFDDAAAGGREPEVEAARDQLAAARASQREATENLDRQRELFAQGIVPRARLDEAEAAASAANARVAEMRQRVTLASLPARENQLRALTAEIAAAQAEEDRLEVYLERFAVHAPAAGLIERQIRYEGELAGPGQPVFRLLPDGALHAVIFIPEAEIGDWAPGDTLSADCTSCADGLSVTLTRIDPQPSFTPPVIYSEDQRERLVFRAEAGFNGAVPPAGTPLTFRPE